MSQYIEFWVHRRSRPDDAEIMSGSDWRHAREIATNPPADVTLVERVVTNGNDADGVTDQTFEVMYSLDG